MRWHVALVFLLLALIPAPQAFAQGDAQSDPAAISSAGPPGDNQGDTSGPDTTRSRTLAVPNYWNSATPPPEPTDIIRQIRFATSNDFPPFNFIGANDNVIGFHIDLARAICEILNAQCTMQVAAFTDLPGVLTSQAADVLIAGHATTAAGLENALFSDDYLTFPGRFVALVDTDLDITPAELAGKSIGVVTGSAHERFIEAYFPRSSRTAFDTPSEMRTALKEGDVEIAFDDAVTASFWLAGGASDTCCQFLGGPFVHASYFDASLRMAIGPQSQGLEASLNYALFRVFSSGRYTEIYLRYFPISPF